MQKNVSVVAGLATAAVGTLVTVTVYNITLLFFIPVLALLILTWLWQIKQLNHRQVEERAQISKIVRERLLDDGQDNITPHRLNDYLTQITSYIQAIGNGQVDSDLAAVLRRHKASNSRSLAEALLKLTDNLREIKAQDEIRQWSALGVARFADILRSGKVFSEIIDHFIAELVKYIAANQGAVFTLKQFEGNDILQMQSCYAYNRKKFQQLQIAPGQGLVGQAFLERDIIFLTDVPPDYINITSGLGEARPRCVAVVPVIFQDDVHGVIEIASFQILMPHHLEFLSKVGTMLGASISQITTAEVTKELLKASQLQAAQLRSQEEELKQNLEELQATQEAVEDKSREAQEHNMRLKAVLDSTADVIMTLNDQGGIESINKAGIELFNLPEAMLIGRPFDSLIAEGEIFTWGAHKQYLQKRSEVMMKGQGGRSLPVEIFLNRTALKSGDVVTAVISDITLRKNAEQDQRQYVSQLQAQEEELRQNMEELSATQEEIHRQLKEIESINSELDARVAALNTSTIMSESDLYGNIIFINDKFCEVSQYSREELIRKPHKIVRHPDMPGEVFALMWSTIKAGKVFRGIVKNRKKDGSHYWVDAVISPVLNDQKQPVKYIGVRYVIEDEELGQRLFAAQLQRLGLNLTLTDTVAA